MDHCSCGMSMVLNSRKCMDEFLVPGVSARSGNAFFLLLLNIACASFFHGLLRRSKKSVTQKTFKLRPLLWAVWLPLEALSFFIGWGLMMASMTANIYVLLSMLAGILLDKALHRLRRPSYLEDGESSGCCP